MADENVGVEMLRWLLVVWCRLLYSGKGKSFNDILHSLLFAFIFVATVYVGPCAQSQFIKK